MSSFLKELEKNYELFRATDEEIISLFQFPVDVYNTWRLLFVEANNKYLANCQKVRKNINKVSKVLLQKDKSQRCYLTVIGNDDHTILVIRSNDSNPEDYKNIAGKKITEEEFAKKLDYMQRKRLEQLKIPSRFIKDEFPELDICEGMDIPLLIEYYRYINDYLNPVVTYNEPENVVGPPTKPNPSQPRKNSIIALDDRKIELLKRKPVRIIKFIGSKTGSRFDAYIYERGDFTLAVVEPVSGMEYQYNLNLGTVDKKNIDLIKEMIKAALEAKEDIVMQDDAIMRKNHTTIDVFRENLDIFLGHIKKTGKFSSDINKSNAVYKR